MDILSVSQFNQVLNGFFGELGEFAVEGEIVSMGHSKGNAVFIDLKDPKEQALLKVSNFAPWVEGLKQVSEGMHVVVHGKPEIYSPYGSFSFKVRKIAPVGEGALQAAFENLKKALDEEGLFAPERKRNLPSVVTKIALITGDESAAYSDFTKIIAESGHAIELEFFPVHVQGERSVDEVESALEYNGNRENIDAIALVRGGGSLEDLASFNSERVARAVYKSKVPIVVGVGHEVDTSIADLVADVRASTPSQAAYYLLQQNSQFLDNVQQIIDHLGRETLSIIPTDQGVNEILHFMELRIRQFVPKSQIIDNYLRTLNMGLVGLKGNLSSKLAKVQNYQSLLEAYNPRNTLKRGYALVRKDGKYLSTKVGLSSGDKLDITLKDGEISTIIDSTN